MSHVWGVIKVIDWNNYVFEDLSVRVEPETHAKVSNWTPQDISDAVRVHRVIEINWHSVVVRNTISFDRV